MLFRDKYYSDQSQPQLSTCSGSPGDNGINQSPISFNNNNRPSQIFTQTFGSVSLVNDWNSDDAITPSVKSKVCIIESAFLFNT